MVSCNSFDNSSFERMSDDTLIDLLHMELVGRIMNLDPALPQQDKVCLFLLSSIIFTSLIHLLSELHYHSISAYIFHRMKPCPNLSILAILLDTDSLKGLFLLISCWYILSLHFCNIHFFYVGWPKISQDLRMNWKLWRPSVKIFGVLYLRNKWTTSEPIIRVSMSSKITSSDSYPQYQTTGSIWN